MLDLSTTPLQLLQRLQPMEPETRLRAQLGRFGFGVDRAEVRIGKLSGGEKARLLLSLISRDAPHLLLLDEPTNHLDVDARQALIEALGEFQGAVVLISHDPHLVSLTADRLWLVADGGTQPFDGDMEDYRRLLMEQRRAERARGRDRRKADRDSTTVNKKDKRRAAAEARAAVADLRKDVRKAEQRIEKLSQRKTALERRLADPQVYDGPTAQLMELQMKFADLKRQLETAEEDWLKAQARLEAASEQSPQSAAS